MVVRVPSLSTPTVREQGVSPSASVPRSTGSDTTSKLAAGTLFSSAEVMEGLAAQEEEMLQQRDKTRMLTQLSTFDVQSSERVLQLETEGTGDKPFVQGVMDDLRQRSDEFLQNVPNYLQDEARQRLLPVQSRVAKKAVAVENIRVQESMVRDFDEFQNNMINRVRFAGMSEEDAMAQIGSYADNLPVTLRDEKRAEGTQFIRAAVLNRELSSNPAQVRKDIKSGKFNDLDPSLVNQAYQTASKTIIDQQNAFNKARKKAYNSLIDGDSAGAARTMLDAEGVQNPSRSQLIEKQKQLGVPRSKIAVLDKQEAEKWAYELSSAETITDFYAKKESLLKTVEDAGEFREKIVQDIVGMAGMSPAFKLLMNSNPSQTPPEFASAAFQLVRDPDAAKSAKKVLTRELGTGGFADVTEAASEAVSEELSVLIKSDSSIGTVEELSSITEDLASVMWNQYRAQGDSDPTTKVTNVLKSSFGDKEYRTENNDGYYLPTGMAGSFSESTMNALKEELVSQGDVFVYNSFAGAGSKDPIIAERARERGVEYFSKNAGWVMVGPNTLGLKTSSLQPVYRSVKRSDGTEAVEPIEISFDDLANIGVSSEEISPVEDDFYTKDFSGTFFRTIDKFRDGLTLSREGLRSAVGEFFKEGDQ